MNGKQMILIINDTMNDFVKSNQVATLLFTRTSAIL